MIAKVIIVDDESRAHKVLEKYIRKLPQLDLVGSFDNALHAAAFVKENFVDIILLDITMPEVDGFAFIDMLPQPPLVIFTTAHSEFALQSYNYNAVDYLMKPIPYARFLKAINKAFQFFQISQKKETPRIIELKIGDKIGQISIEDIFYLQSFGNYIKVHTSERFFITKCTTQEIEKYLSKETFLRIHKSYIVNKNKIIGTTKNSVLLNNISIPIGRTFMKYVADSLN